MKVWVSVVILNLFILTGCSALNGSKHNSLSSMPLAEAIWIREGESIEIDGNVWSPTDEVENFLEGETYYLGQYHGVAFFLDRMDVKPYQRLYTKFSNDRYRAFERVED